jgi:hypothetical protein
MHYIKRLQKENEILQNGLYDLLKYVRSEKFHKDQSVNAADIILRLQETRNAVYAVEDENTEE